MKPSMVRNLVSVGLCTAFLCFVSLDPGVLANHHGPAADAILDTSVAMTGTLVALLVMGRFHRSRSLSDLLVVGAVLLLAWVHTCFELVPALTPHMFNAVTASRIQFWGTSITRLLAAGYLFVSTLPVDRVLSSPLSKRASAFVFAAPALVATAVITSLVTLAPTERLGLLSAPARHALLSPALQIAGAGLLILASFRLTTEADRAGDPFRSWLATGCVFLAFAMVSFALFPANEFEWLRPADILREATVATWAWGAVNEILSYWTTIERVARIETRRSVALEIHDGLTQELALINSYTFAPPEVRATTEWHRQLRASAQRALVEARRTITTLTEDVPVAQPGAHSGAYQSPTTAAVTPDGDQSARPRAAELNAVALIVREAVANALRHSHAHDVVVQLSETDGGQTLRVTDDGAGFDVDAVAPAGHYGLASMRERAASMGASLTVQSRPGDGTVVELVWG